MVLAMISSMLCYLIDGVYNQVELMRSIICHKVVTFGPKHLSLLLDCSLLRVRITSPRYIHSCFITSICITFFSDVESFFLWVKLVTYYFYVLNFFSDLEGSFVLVIHSIYVYASPWGPWVFWCLKHVVSKCIHCNWMVKNVEYLGSLTNVKLFLFFCNLMS
jgi:hypothetical protein